MNKTLKILMAIVLFVAVLAIAGCVNAAEIKDENATVDLDYLTRTPATEGGTDFYVEVVDGVYTFKEAYAGAIKLNKNVTVDLAGVTVGDVVIPANTTITLKDTAADANKGKTGDITVKGTLNMEANTAKTVYLTGSLNVKKGFTVTAVESKVDYTIKENAGKITRFIVAEDDKILTIEDGAQSTKPSTSTNATFVKVKDVNGVTYYGNEELLSYEVSLLTIPDGKTVDLSNVEIAPKEYAVKVVVKFNNKEVEAVADAASVALSNTVSQNKAAMGTPAACVDNDQTVYAKILFKSAMTENDVISLTFDVNDKDTNVADPIAEDVKATLKVATATEPTQTPDETTDPTNTPDEVQPTNTPDTNNGDDLDETPKTGDHIIPATAILAVVVVANVVYFAKMKRN